MFEKLPAVNDIIFPSSSLSEKENKCNEILEVPTLFFFALLESDVCLYTYKNFPRPGWLALAKKTSSSSPSPEQMAGMCVVNADEATMLRSRFWLSRKIGPTSFLFCGVVPLIYGLLLLLAHTNALK